MDLIALEQPFARPPWNYTGTESVASIANVPANVIDWVLVELRPVNDISTVAGQGAAFLLDNGRLQDVNGDAGATVNGASDGDYYTVIRSRNHLATISAFEATLPNDVFSPVDFTFEENVFGANQVADMGDGWFAQFAGDFNSDGVIIVQDFNFYTTQQAQINQYLDSDCNFDGNATVGDYNLYLPNASIIGTTEIRYW